MTTEQPETSGDDYHEPSDEAFACIRLEVFRPEMVDRKDSKEAWKELRWARNTVGQAVQLGMGDLILHVRNLRADGKVRFSTAAERLNLKMGIPLPTECYEDVDTKAIPSIFGNALKKSGLSEYVYASVARRIEMSELSGEKLRKILRGETTYPSMRRLGVMMRSRNWKLETSKRVKDGKEYTDVAVVIAALRPGLGKMRIVVKSLRGPKLRRSGELLAKLEELQFAASGNGWSKGALTINTLRRPGQMEKWVIQLPYSSPRLQGAVTEGPVIAVHRGVANMLTAASSTGKISQFPGRDVISLKFQMHARRRAVSRDLNANPHKGRGVKVHFKALARLSNAEKRATETHLWRAARWVQTVAETAGARLVLLDDFGSFNPDKPGPPFEAYVRTFPLAELKSKVIDAVTRRAGIPVQEVSSRYLSQKCPKCSHVAEKNVLKMPTIRGIDVTNGTFLCTQCDFTADLDGSAVMNMLKDNGF